MDDIDVTALRLGIDERARAEVQRAMRDLAERGDTDSNEGLVQLLREAVALLRGIESAWTHAAVVNAPPMPPEEAEARFVQLTTDARSRFEDEVIRNAHGEKRHLADLPELPPSDAPGVVVVTLVVAAHRELDDLADVRDRDRLRLAFDALVAIDPADFVAMEVIWSPADENDRASVAAIEAKYPELVRLAPSGVA